MNKKKLILVFVVITLVQILYVQFYYWYLEYQLSLTGINIDQDLIPNNLTKEQVVLLDKIFHDTSRGMIWFFAPIISLILFIPVSNYKVYI